MDYLLTSIIADVRLTMNEIGINESDFDSGADEGFLDSTIEGKAIEALRYVHGNAQTNLLEPNVYWDGTPTAKLAAGFKYSICELDSSKKMLRLAYAGYDEWSRMVDSMTYSWEKDWPMLFDKYTTGTLDRPKVGFREVKGESGVVQQVLLFPKPDVVTTTSLTLAYMSEPKWEGTGSAKKLYVSERLSHAFVYYLAGLVLLTREDSRAQNAIGIAVSLMGHSDKISNVSQQDA